MGLTWVVAPIAAIAFGGAVFMLRFLLALLREGAPAARYWAAPTRQKRQIEHLQFLRIAYDVAECREKVRNYSGFAAESFAAGSLEGQNHAKDEHGSGLIDINVCVDSSRQDWRAIHARCSYIFREPL